jgi:hypothetical protein
MGIVQVNNAKKLKRDFILNSHIPSVLTLLANIINGETVTLAIIYFSRRKGVIILVILAGIT